VEHRHGEVLGARRDLQIRAGGLLSNTSVVSSEVLSELAP
jgi:hypothetical protein